MKRQFSILSSALLIALMMSVSGCSSSQTSDSEYGDVPPDAGTDAVPAETAENATPAQGQDSNSANAAPADQQQVASTGDQQTAPADGAQTAAQPDQTTQPVAATDSTHPAQPAATTPDPAAANSLQAATTPATDTTTAAVAPITTPETTAPVAAAETPATDTTTAAATASTTSTDSGSENYNVHRGDTLMRIAFEKYGDIYKWHAIYEANKDKIKDPNVILPGTTLTLASVGTELPARTGKRYVIKHGDTLARISNKVYGTPSKWKKIWEHNKPWIPNPNKIFAGFYLYYTGGKDPGEMQQEENNPTPLAETAPDTSRVPASAQTAAAAAPVQAPATAVAPQVAAPAAQAAAPAAQAAAPAAQH